MRVLLVEDDEPVAESLIRGLSRYGYDVEWVSTAAAALAAGPADMVLVDLGLPDMDGLDVCRELRARGDVPIIVISARADEVDKVVGLEIGADDYVSKPFGVREVIARMRAVLRRVRPAEPEPATGRLEIDRRARRVFVDGAEISLAPKEHDLLAFLAEAPGAAFTREQRPSTPSSARNASSSATPPTSSALRSRRCGCPWTTSPTAWTTSTCGRTSTAPPPRWFG